MSSHFLSHIAKFMKDHMSVFVFRDTKNSESNRLLLTI